MILAACADESISAFADPAGVYRWDDGDATIAFPAPGTISGKAPCNSYVAEQTAPYPWFAIGPIRATQLACPALAQEKDFFEALATMTIAEVSGPILILSNEAGAEMTFRAE